MKFRIDITFKKGDEAIQKKFNSKSKFVLNRMNMFNMQVSGL